MSWKTPGWHAKIQGCQPHVICITPLCARPIQLRPNQCETQCGQKSIDFDTNWVIFSLIIKN